MKCNLNIKEIKKIIFTFSGTQRPVRRTVLPSSSPLAKGITWQWEGDALGSWCDFDIEIINFLDECFVKGQKLIDLSKSKFFLPYHIDLNAMTQKRIETGRVRNIQRTFTSVSYPKESSLQTSSSMKRQSSQSAGKSSMSAKKSRSSTVPAAAVGATTTTTVSTVPIMTVSNSVNMIPHSAHSNPMSLNAHIPNPFNLGHQGPLTRRRYIQSQSALSQHNQSNSLVPPSNQSIPVTMPSTFSSLQSHSTSVPQTGTSFMTFSNFQSGMFGNQGSNNVGITPPVFGGSHMPSFSYHQTNTGNSSQPGHFLAG